MSIRFLDAVKYNQDLTHQIDAWEYLQKNVSEEVLEEFARRYRNQAPPCDGALPTLEGIPEPGIELIKEFEGFSSKAYYDPHTGALPITIAYGSTRKMDGTPFYIGETITREEGEKLLIYQLNKEFIPPLQKIPYWSEMNDKMKSALISFAYNLGANFYGASGFNTITRVLKEKKWNEVPDALILYRNPGSSVEAGLRRRRIAEGKMWMEGLKVI